MKKRVGNTVSVREGKNRFSDLVRRAAVGEEITITSHGRPRARLCALGGPARRFRVDWNWLRTMKVAAGQTPAEELVRSERDERD